MICQITNDMLSIIQNERRFNNKKIGRAQKNIGKSTKIRGMSKNAL